MKNILIKAILFLITVAPISSCKKYLDLSPVSTYNARSFYKTQKDFELAVIGLYNINQSLTNNDLPKALEARSDNVDAYHPYQYDQGYAILSMFTDNSQTPTITNIWKSYWVMIDRCNAIISQIDAGVFSDEVRRSNLKGEAYFFRGYAYFQLGWMYGGVPIIDRQMKVDEIKRTKRSTQEETLAFAAADLSLASTLLPDIWVTTELGKVTKYAADGILARLYMFQKNYQEAQSLLNNIIISGKYVMSSTYANCFLDAYDNSTEHVFQVQFRSGNVGQGNAFVASVVPKDIRSPTFPTGGGPDMNVSYDLYNSYQVNDIRRDFNILKGFNTSTGQTDNTTLCFIKLAHGAVPTVKSDFAVNMPILRYTDVKMMYAECLNEDGYDSNGEAFAILNEVRYRAGLIIPLTSAQVPTQEAFREVMLKERRLEFACEALRWFDLVRTGKAVNVMNSFFARSDQGSGKYKIEEYRLIFAIPQDELNINPNTEVIWQNPMY